MPHKKARAPPNISPETPKVFIVPCSRVTVMDSTASLRERKAFEVKMNLLYFVEIYTTVYTVVLKLHEVTASSTFKLRKQLVEVTASSMFKLRKQLVKTDKATPGKMPHDLMCSLRMRQSK